MKESTIGIIALVIIWFIAVGAKGYHAKRHAQILRSMAGGVAGASQSTQPIQTPPATPQMSGIPRHNHMRKPMTPASGKAKALIVLLWIQVAVQAICAIAQAVEMKFLSDMDHGYYVSDSAFDLVVNFDTALSGLYMIIFFVFVILLMVWNYAAYKNLSLLGVRLQFGLGWAAGGWICPIIALFRPYQILKELFSKTSAVLRFYGAPSAAVDRTGYFGAWLALWLITIYLSNFLFQIVFRTDATESAASLYWVTLFYVIESLLEIPLCLLMIRILHSYSEAERLLMSVNMSVPYTGPGSMHAEWQGAPYAPAPPQDDLYQR